ncbi:putative hemolysin [Ruegeria meonggei]|uniref:putative hemolysin n=1 Tax=Ruegeria meonggei TaxID=1446476 RepID=UPI003671790D
MSRILLSALGLALLAACDESPSSDATAQLANPAATYCIDSGARYEIRDGDNGQSGVCILSDGTEIDAWEYFRENHSG